LSRKSDAKLGDVPPTPLAEIKVVIVATKFLLLDYCCVDFAYYIPKKTFKHYFEHDDLLLFLLFSPLLPSLIGGL
jgi:hypothetical protein